MQNCPSIFSFVCLVFFCLFDCLIFLLHSLSMGFVLMPKECIQTGYNKKTLGCEGWVGMMPTWGRYFYFTRWCYSPQSSWHHVLKITGRPADCLQRTCKETRWHCLWETAWWQADKLSQSQPGKSGTGMQAIRLALSRDSPVTALVSPSDSPSRVNFIGKCREYLPGTWG